MSPRPRPRQIACGVNRLCARGVTVRATALRGLVSSAFGAGAAVIPEVASETGVAGEPAAVFADTCSGRGEIGGGA